MAQKASESSTFVRDRNEALLSLDQFTIEEYGLKYGVKMNSDPDIFWGSVHKARTAIALLIRAGILAVMVFVLLAVAEAMR